ncbi:accessory factor associated with RNA polymerase II [Malassezia pachydermatis]
MGDAVGSLDPLLSLRASLCASADAPLQHIQLRDTDGAVVDSVKDAASVVILHVDATTLQVSDAAPEQVYPAGTPTRILRTHDTKAREGGAPTPESEPEAFMSIAALVFAVQQRDERTGAYLRSATLAQMTPLPALERPAVLEYLLGKREVWDGVVPLPGTGEDATAPNGTAPSAASASTAQPGTEAQTHTTKRVYVPDAEDAEFVRRLRSKYEVVLLERDDALRGSHCTEADDVAPGTRSSSDLLGLRKQLAPQLEAAKRRMSSSAKAATSSSAKNPPTSAPANAARKSRAQDPIILLSNSPTALVNMFNVKALLQDGVFVPPEEARQQANGLAELVVTIRAPSSDESSSTGQTGSLTRRILVVDNAEAVNRLGNGPPGSAQDPWNRVIAVFTTGQAWQFKSYRWTDPRDLFRNGTYTMTCTHTTLAMGVYVRWNNEAPSAQVKDWNVTQLQVRGL